MKKTRVLFVCLGNICRSPLAEAIFLKMISDRGLHDQFEVDSCGTANYHVGEDPDPRTIQVARNNGVPMEHLGRQLSTSDLEYFDLVLAMDQQNLKNIEGLINERSTATLQMMRSYENNGSGTPLGVPDPWYGDESDFDRCFQLLESCCSNLLDELSK